MHTCLGSGKVRLLNTKQELRSKDYYTLFKHTTPKEKKLLCRLAGFAPSPL